MSIRFFAIQFSKTFLIDKNTVISRIQLIDLTNTVEITFSNPSQSVTKKH